MKVGIITEVMDLEDKSGIPNYLKYILANIPHVNREHEFCLIHYQKSNNQLYKNMDEIIVPLYNVKPTRFLQTVATDAIKLTPILKENDIDVIHNPSPTPFHNPLFLQNGFKKVMTIHDLYKFLPSFQTKLHQNPKMWMHDVLWRKTLFAIRNNVDKFIAVSNNTKQDMVKFLKVPEEKIETIYSAPHDRFKQIKMDIPEYIDAPFILSDNIRSDIIEMYYRLRKKGVYIKLVIFGSGNVTSQKRMELEKMIAYLGLNNDIIFAGRVSDEEMVKLYNTAEIYIRPSWYEGFGLPPLEAMACGCPVIVSNVGALPEVVADAGILANPHNVDEWTTSMYKILTNEDFKEELIHRGLERAKLFSWEKTTKRTVEVYEKVYNS
ncbi:glycosyltransferase [Methanolobus tindarius DSM 2278]|jgi:glycosyltransferase involved in cell wall biosynthesis|uniref:Glycosyltransferase n=1 Tax=Methanolobus tindarius DSM 2278 TaxID=1090322 RepID=W9DUT2_METTI|nr:glycosyltransferase family 1 protein [Methanolobus tindarius]ETA67447.1 glycosyltransferase [Methanolobus tindarius DSM 2278]